MSTIPGLTSLEEDFQHLGLTPPRRATAPEALLRMEESFTGWRRGALSRLNEGSAPSPRRQPAAPAAPRSRVSSALAAFEGAAGRAAPVQHFHGVNRSTVSRLMESVNRSLNQLQALDRAEAVRAWAQTAVIAETFRFRFNKIGRVLGEQRLTGVSKTYGALAERASQIVKMLREGRTPKQLPAMMGQALRVVAEGLRLYGGLTEGADAPFPVPPSAPGAAKPPSPEEDPLALGAGSPTQGMEGMTPPGNGMPGGMEGEDPLSLGGFGVDPMQGAAAGPGPKKPPMGGAPGAPSMESADGLSDNDTDWNPYGDGADDPDLIEGGQPDGDGDGDADDADPLALG